MEDAGIAARSGMMIQLCYITHLIIAVPLDIGTQGINIIGQCRRRYRHAAVIKVIVAVKSRLAAMLPAFGYDQAVQGIISVYLVRRDHHILIKNIILHRIFDPGDIAYRIIKIIQVLPGLDAGIGRSQQAA